MKFSKCKSLKLPTRAVWSSALIFMQTCLRNNSVTMSYCMIYNLTQPLFYDVTLKLLLRRTQYKQYCEQCIEFKTFRFYQQIYCDVTLNTKPLRHSTSSTGWARTTWRRGRRETTSGGRTCRTWGWATGTRRWRRSWAWCSTRSSATTGTAVVVAARRPASPRGIRFATLVTWS